MGAYSDIIDIGDWFGLKQQPYADTFVQHSITDPLVLNSGSVGFNISQAQTRFPNYMGLLTLLGWSNADKLALTYATCAFNEAMLTRQGGIDGFGFGGRENMYIPSGVWAINSEIRAVQGRIIGKSQAINAGGGGTVIRIHPTGWKSLYGAQNDGVRVMVVPYTYAGENNASSGKLSPYGNHEWAHWFKTEHIRFVGTAANNSFYNPANPVEIGVMWWNPGEGSGPVNCAFSNFKGLGFLVSNNIAPFTALDCEMFYNEIAAIGQRGGAYSKSRYMGMSGDNNPLFFVGFQAGSNILGTGPFLPHASVSNPGGVYEFIGTKVEAFACRGGYGGFSTCTPANLAGKGGPWARLSGRFYATFINCTLNVHSGRIFSAIEVIDNGTMNAAFPGDGWGTLPMDNSDVKVVNCQMYGVRNYLVDWRRQRSFPVEDVPEAAKYHPSWHWNNHWADGRMYSDGRPTPLEIAHTPATHRGFQPVINQSQIGSVNWTGGTPNFNYNPLTGVNY